MILYSCITQALRKEINAGSLSDTNSEGKRCKQLQHIMKIFKSIVIAYSACFSLFCVYLMLKMTFPEIFIKDKCKWILGFSYFVLPLLSTAMNPVTLFFSSNFRRRTSFCCSCFKVTRPSFFGGVPSYFEALWYPHLYFYRKSNTYNG